MHVAADNYLIPAAIGFPADPATGIKGDDYKTAVAFEQRTANKVAAIAEMEKSFAFLKKSLAATGPDKLNAPVSMFGMNLTSQKAWIMATTHLHEHLGQLIAYARSNADFPESLRADATRPERVSDHDAIVAGLVVLIIGVNPIDAFVAATEAALGPAGVVLDSVRARHSPPSSAARVRAR